MLARGVGIVLGVILATSGYVVAGWGSLGMWATNLDLGPFEPHRPAAGAAAAILGGMLIVAALLPRKKRRRIRTAPMAFGQELEQRTSPEPVAPVPGPAPAPQPMVAPVFEAPSLLELAPAPVEPPPPPVPVAPPPPPTFAQLRARLVSLCREESWAEVARTLAAMKTTADTDEELALVHRDVGDFARGHGQMDDAAEAYETSVAYARLAHQVRPGEETVDLLAGALSGVGDVAEAEGRLDAALSAFEEALALRRAGVDKESDVGAKRALSVNLERLADLREDRGHRMRALDLYRESHCIAACLAAADPARFGPDLAATRARMDELEARIGN